MGDRVQSKQPCRVTDCPFVQKYVKDPDGKMTKPDRILLANHLMMCHAFQVGEAHQAAGLRSVT